MYCSSTKYLGEGISRNFFLIDIQFNFIVIENTHCMFSMLLNLLRLLLRSRLQLIFVNVPLAFERKVYSIIVWWGV